MYTPIWWSVTTGINNDTLKGYQKKDLTYANIHSVAN